MMQLRLGTDVFTSLSVTEGVVSKLARVTWKKASGESSSPAFSLLPPDLHSLFFFFLVYSFCWDRFQPDQPQLAPLPPAPSC